MRKEVNMIDILKKVTKGEDLSKEEMITAIKQIMSEDIDPILASSLLTALKIKGEAIDEIAGAAMALREKALSITIDDECTLDTCGTGGDYSGTFNISTAVAFVSAAAGIKVCKHGNRSVSSKCGCADVLEEVGIPIVLKPEQVKQLIEETNFGFLFAPTHHKAMKHVMPVRKALKLRTLFNIIGPLSNPANANYQLVGVYEEKLVEIFAQALSELKITRALVVHGKDGLDEMTTTEDTLIAEVKDDKYKIKTIKPEDFGLKRTTLDALKGGDATVNKEIMLQIFKGKKGPKRDIVLLNSGAALYITGKSESINEGIEIAKELIDSGKVLKKLEEYKERAISMVQKK